MTRNLQFSAAFLLTLLTVTLVVMALRRDKGDGVPNRSRWMMASGMALASVQFLLQYTLRLRDEGITQGVILNLLMFVPCSWLLSLSVLYLQRQGRLSLLEWLAGGLAWLVVGALLVWASIGDGLPFFCDSPKMRHAEWVCAVVYAVMQGYYTSLQIMALRRMRRQLNDYYDRDMDSLLRWMQRSIWTLALVAVFVPVAIFVSGWPLLLFALLCLSGLYYLVHSFRDYVRSKNFMKVMAAQQNAVDAGIDEDDAKVPTISDEDRRRVALAVDQWMAKKQYLRSGITMPTVAAELHVTQPLLRAWYHAAGFESYPDWMQRMRIDHAKKLMDENPGWALETIAEQCGFSSRNYFHKVFQKSTGMTPAQYMKQTAKASDQ